MNVLDPISTIMSTKLITANPKDKLEEIQAIFANNRIHHIPIVRYKELVGLISKTDLLAFLKGSSQVIDSTMANRVRLKHNCAEDIMTTGIAKLSPNDHISTAIEVFKENLFHAIPIVEGEELVGILTTYDIIAALSLVKAS